jgi:hypothetical protein
MDGRPWVEYIVHVQFFSSLFFERMRQVCQRSCDSAVAVDYEHWPEVHSPTLHTGP